MEFYHHGIKGMHWGVRRFQNEDGTLTEAGRTHYGVGNYLKKAVHATTNYYKKRSQAKREAKAKAAEFKHPKTAANMSDEELRQRLSRLQLEKQYSQLRKELYPEKNIVKKLINDSIDKIGTAAANNLVQYGTQKIKEAMFPPEVQKTLNDLSGLDLGKLSKKQLSEYSEMVGFRNKILGIDNPSNSNSQQETFTKTLAQLEKMDIKQMSKKELTAYNEMRNTAEKLSPSKSVPEVEKTLAQFEKMDIKQMSKKELSDYSELKNAVEKLSPSKPTEISPKVEKTIEYYLGKDAKYLTESEAKAAVEFINHMNTIEKYKNKDKKKD